MDANAQHYLPEAWKIEAQRMADMAAAYPEAWAKGDAEQRASLRYHEMMRIADSNAAPDDEERIALIAEIARIDAMEGWEAFLIQPEPDEIPPFPPYVCRIKSGLDELTESEFDALLLTDFQFDRQRQISDAQAIVDGMTPANEAEELPASEAEMAADYATFLRHSTRQEIYAWLQDGLEQEIAYIESHYG